MIDTIVGTFATLSLPVQGVPLALRAGIGLVALALVVRGAGLARQGVRLAAAMCGALLALLVVMAAPEADRLHAALALAGVACLGGAALLWVEVASFRLALGVCGLVAGAALGAAVRDVLLGQEIATWAPLTLGVSLALVMPWFFETIPKVLSPLVGAVGLAWALGVPTSLPILAAAWGLGATLQLFTGPEEIFLDEDDHVRRSALR